MRTFAIGLAAALSLACAAKAAELEIQNDSQTTIQHLYVSDASSNKWGPDQLGDRRRDVIKPGASFTLTGIDRGRYDLKLVAADDTVCVIEDQRIGQDKVWTITEHMLDHCD